MHARMRGVTRCAATLGGSDFKKKQGPIKRAGRWTSSLPFTASHDTNRKCGGGSDYDVGELTPPCLQHHASSLGIGEYWLLMMINMIIVITNSYYDTEEKRVKVVERAAQPSSWLVATPQLSIFETKRF
jgi:hypothetical protein